MKCNLLLLSCLFVLSVTASGQKKKEQKAEPVKLTIPGSAILRAAADASEVKFDYKQLNAPLPKFDIVNHENRNTTKEVLETGGNLVLMMFNPTCDHCEDETRLMIDNIFLFKKSKMLLVAAAMQMPNLSYFDANVKFSQYPATMTVAIDSAKLISQLFNYVALPQINIYDGTTHRLLKTFNGFQPLDSLRQYIQ